MSRKGLDAMLGLGEVTRWGLWGAAAAGVWLFIVNRVVLQWSHLGIKRAAMVLFALGLVVMVRAAIRRPARRWWHCIPLLIVSGFACGEVRRTILRAHYRGTSVLTTPAATDDLTDPFTDTEIDVQRRVVEVPRLRGMLRVVHLTDLHLNPSLPWEYFESVVARVNAENPDLIVLTGDYLSDIERLPLLAKWLERPLLARLGVFAVLGNHDYWSGAPELVRSALQGAGIEVLSGRCAHVTAHTVLCGTESPWGEDFTTSRTGADDVVLALSHTPDNIYALKERADLVFSGHNHGGQWRIPVLGALVVPSAYGRRFDRGAFSVDGTELFVSAGIGAEEPPHRIFCPPELFVVDLVGKSAVAWRERRAERPEKDAVGTGG